MLVQFHNRWRGIMPGIHDMGLGVALEHIKAGRAIEIKEDQNAVDPESKHPRKRGRKKPAAKGGDVNQSNSGSSR